jgi:hypothetical protein
MKSLRELFHISSKFTMFVEILMVVAGKVEGAPLSPPIKGGLCKLVLGF